MVLARTAEQLTQPMEADERILQRADEILDRSRQLALLNLLLTSIHHSLEEDQVLKNAVHWALEAFPCEAGGIYLLNESSPELTLAFSHGVPSIFLSSFSRVKMGEGVIGQTVEQREPVLVQLTGMDPRFPLPGWSREGFQLFLAIPLRSQQQTVGALFLASRQSWEAPPTFRQFLTSLGEIIGTALEHARRYRRSVELSERERRRAAQLHHVSQIGRQILLALGSSKLVTEAARLVHDVLGYPFVSVFSVEEKTEQLILRATAGTFAQTVPVGSRQSLYQGMAGWVARHGEPLLANDVTKEPRFHRLYAETKAELDVPIALGGRTTGVLAIHSDRPFAFTSDDLSLAEIVAGYMAVGLHAARLLEESYKRNDRLTQTERSWRLLVETLPFGLLLVQNDVIRYANRHAVELTGYAPDELYRLGRFSEIVAESCRHALYTEGEDPNGSPETALVRLTLVRKDRRPLTVDVIRLSLAWDGHPASALVLMEAHEPARLREQDLQAEKLAAIAQFVSGIAHELNSPLTSVVGYSELILSEGSLSESAKRDLEMIVAQAHRARKVIQNLLAFARWYTPEKRPVNINDVIEAALRERASQHQAAHIRVQRDLAPALPSVLADKAQLQQVFLNIIVNAEQAMTDAHGGGTLVVQTQAKKKNQGEKEIPIVEIRFQDDGPGISPENLRRIFDPFFTTKPPGVGTGLGLSICYGIVKEHGGDIYALSREGHGATFIIELPIPTIE